MLTTDSRPTLVIETTRSKDAQLAWALLSAASAVICVNMFFCIISGLNLGFDENVEGFYMLSYQHPQWYPTFSSFHLLLEKVPHLISSPILHFRLLELIATAVPSAFLAVASLAFLKARNINVSSMQLAFVVAFTTIGGMVSFASFPRTISYNGLAHALALVASSCAILSTLTNSKLRAALAMVAGICASTCFFAKATTGMALVLLLLGFLSSLKNTIRILPFLAGIFAGTVCYFLLLEPPLTWWHNFTEAISLESTTSHNISTSALAAIAQAVEHWKLLLGGTAAIIVFQKLLRAQNVSCVRTNGFRALCAIVPMLLVGIACKPDYVDSHGALIVVILIAVAVKEWFHETKRPAEVTHAVGVDAAFEQELGTTKQPLWPLIALLAALPPACTLGTNCDFIGYMSSVLAPVFLLIACGSVALSTAYGTRYSTIAIPMSLLLVTAHMFDVQYLYDRCDGAPLANDTCEPVGIAALDGIKLTPAWCQFFERSKTILEVNGYKKGDDLLCLCDLPGLAYALEARSPGQAWYVGWNDRDAVNAHYLHNAPVGPDAPAGSQKKLFLAVYSAEENEPTIYPQTLEALSSKGLKYPDNFERIGQVTHPDTRKRVCLYKLSLAE